MQQSLRKLAIAGLLSLSFSLTQHAASAQVEWQQLYGGKTTETCSSLLPQADGGYLLVGTDLQKGQYKLYLIRTDARGRQLWAKHILPGGTRHFIPLHAFRDDAGNSFIACKDSELGSSTQAFYTTKVDALGNVVDTWKLPLGNKRDLGGMIRQTDGSFVVAAADYSVSGGQSTLLYLDATGRKQREVPLVINNGRGGLIHHLSKAPGGFVVAASIQRVGGGFGEFPTKLIYFSDQGEQGAESELPKFGYQESVRSVLPLGGNDYLVMGDQVHRVTLGNNTPQWTQRLVYDQNWVRAQGAIPTPDGYLFYGSSTVSSHTGRLHLVQTDAKGNLLDGLPAGQNKSAKMIASGLNCGLAGVYAVPGTNGYVVAGYRQGQGDEDIFLSSGSLAQLKVATTTVMQAWPNPVHDEAVLNVSSMVALGDAFELYDLQGKRVRSWPRTLGGDAQLSLQDVQPGIYFLVGLNGQGKRSSVRITKR